jgi:hypothetical protein
LNSALRFDLDSPHRQQELADLKKAIEQAENFYIQQILDWLDEFLSVDVDEIVLAGGSATYIWFKLSEKLSTRIVASEKQVLFYLDENLPQEIAQIKHGDRFLDIYGIWREISAM